MGFTIPVGSGIANNLSQQRFHDLAFDIGQPIIAALESEREPFVIEAEQMQNRRLQIVNENFVLRDAEAELIRFAVRESALRAAAGHHHRVTIRIMIAPENVSFCGASLTEW